MRIPLRQVFLARLQKEEIVEKILEASFVRTYHWSPPTILRGIGPSIPQVFSDFANKLDAFMKSARGALLAESEDVLQASYEYLVDGTTPRSWIPSRNVTQIHPRAAALEPPPWYAGGFSVEGMAPDYNYWVKMSTWSLKEAVALSIGFEPTQTIDENEPHSLVAAEVMEFYRRRRRLVENALFPFSDETVQALQPSPLAFCNWAVGIKLEIPGDLYREVRRLHGDLLNDHGAGDERSDPDSHLDPRERESLLKIIRLLVEKTYGFDASKQRSDVATRLQSDLDLAGLGLHLQTIRKFLKEAGTIRPSEDNDE